MKKATINLYEFSELNEKAKENAIFEHRDFLLSTMQVSDFISGDSEYDTPENLKKSFDSEYDHVLNNDEPIIESIEANEYLFYSDGKLANCTTYCGTHEKTGITELKIGLDIYTL